jgi:lysine decarboxylase
MSDITLGFFSDQNDEESEMGRAQTRAANAYGVERAAYMVHGSTGANAVALGAHKLNCGRLNVLVARGAHHSIINRTLEIGGTLRFARSELNARFEAALPPSPSQIEEALTLAQAAGQPVDLVVVTSPVYEGFHARVPEIAQVAHGFGALLHVDSAWGPLAGFHPSLPQTPVALGADSGSISVHKLGGALSQCALLTWRRDEHLDRAMRLAQIQYCTTSPSYVLAASLDEAIVKLVNNGEGAIDRAIAIREDLKARLLEGLPALEVLESPAVTDRSRTDPNASIDPDAPMDPTRLTIGLAAYSLTGFELSSRLMQVGVVPEKAGVQTLTLFIHIGAGDDVSERVSAAIIDILSDRRRRNFDRALLLPNPLLGLESEAVIEPSSAMTRALVDGESVPLDAAAGRICLELIEAYPPGIPIGVPGFRLSQQAISYLLGVANAGGRVVSLEPAKLGERQKILVLPEGKS